VLVRAVLVCSWRRLRPFLVANPLVAMVALLALPGLPIASYIGGGRVAPSLSKALIEQDGVVEGFVAAIVFSGALAGAIVATVAPGLAVFGSQITVAPIRRMRFLWAGAGFPLALGAFAFSSLLALAALPVFETAPIEEALRALPEQLGVKAKVIFQAVRVAVTGTTVSPPLFESLELLGRDKAVARLDAAVAGVDEAAPRP